MESLRAVLTKVEIFVLNCLKCYIIVIILLTKVGIFVLNCFKCYIIVIILLTKVEIFVLAQILQLF